MITLKYEDIYFKLNVVENTSLLEESQNIDYDQVCENEGYRSYSSEDDEENSCSHEMNRCSVIRNIEKKDFELHNYLRYMLFDRDLNYENVELTEELVIHLLGILSKIDFSEHVDYEKDRGYYGEYLTKIAYGTDQLEISIKNAIKDHPEFKIEVLENV